MAVVLYQRSEPRHKEWLPLLSQQIRLRNLTQIILLNVSEHVLDKEVGYFTLHVSPMSAPFYTSSKVPFARVTGWPEIQLSLCFTRLSASAAILRVWTGAGVPVLSWGVHFRGLHHLGHRDEWNNHASEFQPNTLIFLTPFGSFTSLCSLTSPPVQPQRFLQIKTVSDSPLRSSYTLKKLVSLHHYQRSVLEEHALGERLKMDLGMHGFGVGSPGDNRQQPTLLSERLIQRAKLGRQKLRLKEEIEVIALKVRGLVEEKGRAEGRIRRLKQDATGYEELSADLVTRMHNFTTERTNLKEIKATLISKGQNLGKFRASVFLRKKQLISELLHIYPLELVEGSKKYSVNGVQLPNAEDYGNETGGQISVALGYTAHLAAMLAFFLDIPCRYPIRHFGSRSRIIDHITVQIPDKEREFPLYFKGKRDVYCAYAIYLLNKNVAQLRWYCGLSTPDLRATLPNLVELLTSRLVIPGWPPNIGEALEIAQEITEDVDSNFLENEFTMSLDKGLDKMLSVANAGGAYLADSLSDGNPGGNSTALGDIQHGRGQDRFLSGWKKKTYIETDDFDPKWLMDSMNLDFDSGRKLSMSNSSPPPRPTFIITGDDSDGGPSRRRRMGQVEAPSLENLQEGKIATTIQAELRRTQTPSREIARLELDIKESERRKSRGAATSVGVPTSSEISSATIKQSPPPPLLLSPSSSCPNIIPSLPSAKNPEWTATDEPRLMRPGFDSSNSLLDQQHQSINLSAAHRDEIQVQHSEACNPDYHIPPPSVETVTSSHDADSTEQQNATNSIRNSSTPYPADNTKEVCTTNMTQHSESSLNCDIESPSTTTTNNKHEGDAINGENSENSILWRRTEALLGSQSFNLVRRRMSTSEST